MGLLSARAHPAGPRHLVLSYCCLDLMIYGPVHALSIVYELFNRVSIIVCVDKNNNYRIGNVFINVVCSSSRNAVDFWDPLVSKTNMEKSQELLYLVPNNLAAFI